MSQQLWVGMGVQRIPLHLFPQFKTKCYNFFHKKSALKQSYLFMQLLLSARHILSIFEGGGRVAISQARKLRL